MSGQVFHDIAEGIMAKRVKYDAKGAGDSTSVKMPDVKAGNILAADYVLSRLGIKTEGGWHGSYAEGNPVWGRMKRTDTKEVVERSPLVAKDKMPDVTGMGARDAVYLVESRGARVIIRGCGKVKSQSKPVGAAIVRGEKVTLELGS
jgi:cell division protein FtsI (penicillin-binding protein 3)